MAQKTIGTDVVRREGWDKVSGTAKYVDDVSMPGMLYGLTIRSSVPRAKIVKVEFDPAFNWSGFTTVTANDIPGKNHVALILEDQPYLAESHINHPAEPVALIAHANRDMLVEAARHVNIVTEALPGVFSIADSRSRSQVVWGDDNIQKKILIDKGDVDSVWANAHQIIEGHYYTGAQEQLYIETNGMIADASPDKVTVWGSLQCPYYVHRALTELFGMPGDKIRVVQLETGGGFGGKEEYPSMLAGHAALLSYKAGKPVKMVYDRAEDMAATTKRHPSHTMHRTAVDRDGKLLAMDIDFCLDGGAYATLSAVVLSRGAIHAAGPYECPNVRIASTAVATNCPPHGAYRGFGAPQSLFAVECHMDRVAAACGLTPTEFRKRNFLHKGGTSATGQMIRDEVNQEEIMNRALTMIDYERKMREYTEANKTSAIRRGIGFSTFYHGAGFTGSGEKKLASVVYVDATPDGRIQVFASSTEIGQGKNTIFCQIVADALQISYDKIDVIQPDTDIVPDSGPTVASRTCMVVGKLVENAARQLLQRLKKEAGLGETWNESSFNEAVARFFESNDQLRIEATYRQPDFVQWNEDTYQGDAYVTFAWACYAADVEVDPVTLEVIVKDFVAVQDIGDVIHPVLAAGQIEGGVAQAIGYSIYEEVKWQNGVMANNNMTNYIMPTSCDLPPIRVEFMPAASPHGPGRGAKGIGELPMDGVAPAIANAVTMALGKNVNQIPITPEAVLELVRSGETHGS